VAEHDLRRRARRQSAAPYATGKAIRRPGPHDVLAHGGRHVDETTPAQLQPDGLDLAATAVVEDDLQQVAVLAGARLLEPHRQLGRAGAAHAESSSGRVRAPGSGAAPRPGTPGW
jgi:hypothetical protein